MAVTFPTPTRIVGITIIDNYRVCTSSQLNVLQNCASLDFKLGKYNSLADILNSLGVKVYIRKGIIEKNMTSFLDKAEKYWMSKLEENQKEYNKNIKILEEERQYSKFRLRGRYLPEEKIIELFPEEMEQEYEGTKMDELLVSTLAHETMHAYFDRPGHDIYPYVYFVEEPLAEFGMLLYLYNTCMPASMQSWAYNDVASKHSCYRYGAQLFDHKGDLALRLYFEDYKCNINEYETLDVSGTTIVLPNPISSRRGIVTSSGKKKLQVVFPDGTIIKRSVSADTFADAVNEAIARCGIDNVVNAANKAKGGKPLISNVHSDYAKYRNMKELKIEGWYVDTDSSNIWKKELLEKLFKELKLPWKVSI